MAADSAAPALGSVPQAALRRFLFGFVGLTLLSGLTIGMNKVLGTLLGLHLGVSNLELAMISSAETVAMALGTLPAARLLARGDPRRWYGGVSLALAALFCALPWLPGWRWVALAMFMAGLCIAVRIVAMSTVFLTRLPELGQGKAGWYRGTLTLGIQFAGPLAGNFLIAHLGLHAGFLASGAAFALLALLGWQVLPAQPVLRRAPPGAGGSLRALLSVPGLRGIYGTEILASFTAASVGVFSLLLAIRELHWAREHAVWLMATQGLAYVVVLLFLGGAVLRSGAPQAVYAAAHGAVMLALLLFALAPTSAAYLGAAVLLGAGLAVNNLVNTDRIARAAVDKARVSSHLTLLGMAGGSAGALLAGRLADGIGLRNVFLCWLLPWAAAWLLIHTNRKGKHHEQ